MNGLRDVWMNGLRNGWMNRLRWMYGWMERQMVWDEWIDRRMYGVTDGEGEMKGGVTKDVFGKRDVWVEHLIINKALV